MRNKTERKQLVNLTIALHTLQTTLVFDMYLLIDMSLRMAAASATSLTQQVVSS